MLTGDPADPRVAWLVTRDGTTQPAVFPDTYTVRFAPEIEVVDAAGKVVLRDGDVVHEGCVGVDGELLILLPQHRAGAHLVPGPAGRGR